SKRKRKKKREASFFRSSLKERKKSGAGGGNGRTNDAGGGLQVGLIDGGEELVQLAPLPFGVVEARVVGHLRRALAVASAPGGEQPGTVRPSTSSSSCAAAASLLLCGRFVNCCN